MATHRRRDCGCVRFGGFVGRRRGQPRWDSVGDGTGLAGAAAYCLRQWRIPDDVSGQRSAWRTRHLGHPRLDCRPAAVVGVSYQQFKRRSRWPIRSGFQWTGLFCRVGGQPRLAVGFRLPENLRHIGSQQRRGGQPEWSSHRHELAVSGAAQDCFGRQRFPRGVAGIECPA